MDYCSIDKSYIETFSEGSHSYYKIYSKADACMNEFNPKITYASLVAGISCIAIGLALVLIFPFKADLPDGFQTPIIAFEFAKTEADLSYLMGEGVVESRNREKMDAGNRWDMFFPFAYGSFILLLLVQMIMNGKRIAWLGVPFALLVVPFDIGENIALLNITEAIRESGALTELLVQLQLVTWLKWGSLGAAIGVLSLAFLSTKEYVHMTVGGLTSLSIAVCWVLGSKPTSAEIMSALTFLCFLFLAVRSIVHTWKMARSTATASVIPS